MNPTSDNPMLPADSLPAKAGWSLYILSPEESERLLREEPRIPFENLLADLYRELGEEPPNE